MTESWSLFFGDSDADLFYHPKIYNFQSIVCLNSIFLSWGNRRVQNINSKMDGLNIGFPRISRQDISVEMESYVCITLVKWPNKMHGLTLGKK